MTRAGMVRRLHDPYVRTLVTAAGHSPGTITNLDDLADDLARQGYFVSPEMAAAPLYGGPRPGWNLCCNRCGTYGATWTREPGGEAYRTERPDWGALALCPTHMAELDNEHVRHARALEELRRVRYEQERTGAST